MRRVDHEPSFNINSKRFVLGALLVVIGGLLFASNIGWLSYEIRRIVLSWPMLLIVIGLISISGKRNNYSGLILVGIGVIFLLPRMFYIPFDFGDLFWPSVFVGIGLVLVLRRGHMHGKHGGDYETSMDYIDDLAIFAGSERAITSDNFYGGKVTSIFGGSTYNLLNCQLSVDQSVIDVFSLFGGSKFIVPADWNVKIEVVSIFGGFSDKRKKFSDTSIDPTKEFIIKGIVIFGGGEIKSV